VRQQKSGESTFTIRQETRIRLGMRVLGSAVTTKPRFILNHKQSCNENKEVSTTKPFLEKTRRMISTKRGWKRQMKMKRNTWDPVFGPINASRVNSVYQGLFEKGRVGPTGSNSSPNEKAVTPFPRTTKVTNIISVLKPFIQIVCRANLHFMQTGILLTKVSS